MDTSKLSSGTPDKMTVFITSEKGSKEYCELDEKSDVFVLRKVLESRFPGFFGFVPRTRGSDTQPMDALVLTVEKLRQGMAVKTVPIGMARLKGKVPSEILVTVLCGDSIIKAQDLLSLNEEELEELGKFFEELKGKEFQNFFGPEQAKKSFEKAVELFNGDAK